MHKPTNPVIIRAAAAVSVVLVGITGSMFLWTVRDTSAPATTVATTVIESSTTTGAATSVPATDVQSTVYQAGNAGQVTVAVIDNALYLVGAVPADKWTLVSMTANSPTDSTVIFKNGSAKVTLTVYLLDGALSTSMETVTAQGTYTGPVNRPTSTTVKSVTTTTVKKPTTTVPVTTAPTTTATTTAPTTTRPPRNNDDD